MACGKQMRKGREVPTDFRYTTLAVGFLLVTLMPQTAIAATEGAPLEGESPSSASFCAQAFTSSIVWTTTIYLPANAVYAVNQAVRGDVLAAVFGLAGAVLGAAGAYAGATLALANCVVGGL